jgi:hypothetical protein
MAAVDSVLHGFLTFCFALLLFSVQFSAQDFSKVDAQARATPSPKNQDIQQLADALSKGCATEKEKARAIYVWIADKIRYDVKSFEKRDDSDPAKTIAKQVPAQVLKSKKAVCAGYSNLFCALCKAAGIEAIQVTGISKNPEGRVSKTGHAWNLVRADGQWALLDATWGAGDVDPDKGKYHERFKEEFFFAAPETLILNHYPDDPLFQLLASPLTLDEFKQDQADVQKTLSENSAEEASEGFAHLKDSLDAYVRLDSIARYFNSNLRTLRFDPANGKGLYSLAILQYNEAIDMFMQTLNEVNSAAQSGDKDRMIETLGRSIERLAEVEAKLETSISTAEKITSASEYHKRARQMLAQMRKPLSECSENIEKMEKMYAQLNSRN